MIRIENLTKRFENRVLFDHFSFVIEQGDFLILTGKSGSGKTTLLNMIGGIESFEEGDILINNKSIKCKAFLRHFYTYDVGFLFQNFALLENNTVKENLVLVKKNARSEYSLEESLKMVGMEDFMDTKVYKLSGGEQQRVALARLIFKRCNIVLADEPTGSLDNANSENVMKILTEINKQGKTVIMVTHNEALLSYATKIIALDDYGKMRIPIKHNSDNDRK